MLLLEVFGASEGGEESDLVRIFLSNIRFLGFFWLEFSGLGEISSRSVGERVDFEVGFVIRD